MVPLVRICSTIASSLVVPKMVSRSCLLGRARRPCEPWPVWKTSKLSTTLTSGIELSRHAAQSQYAVKSVGVGSQRAYRSAGRKGQFFFSRSKSWRVHA
jgi:hypothetical protein